jgi:hypothetical protein
MAGKEETPTCRKKTVTWTNEMIENLVDFIEIHPIVAFEAIYEPIFTSFWSLISFGVQLYIRMQYKGKHPPLLPEMPFCLLYLPPKLVCIHQNFLHRVYTNLNSSLLDPSFLEWRLGCKTCIVYTGFTTRLLLTRTLLSIGFLVVKLKLSLLHHDLVNHYEIYVAYDNGYVPVIFFHDISPEIKHDECHQWNRKCDLFRGTPVYPPDKVIKSLKSQKDRH